MKVEQYTQVGRLAGFQHYQCRIVRSDIDLINDE